MTGRMLIDATHPEETRVVVINDKEQLEDFDFESSTKKQLKGNIYLAKITRVEPSLQAAFVDYGGNRHGFLAFSEIHPDYFQIPQADRELLQQESKAEAAKAAAEGDGADEPAAARAGGGNGGADGDGGGNGAAAGDAETVATDADEEAAEVFDEQARRRSRLLRSYKIQEVIKRRQIMLVQVVKEERGAKGAALTTYLSLAGRYCVLMPNTPRGGGISRKISNAADRKRLKAVAAELQVPDGMGLIIRTAGMERSKVEIRRDYEYLLRLWSDIRDTTLSSIAPCLIYEEANLIKRAVRDLYIRDIDEILVEGEEGYRTARRVMGMLMPSRVRRVRQYKDGVPLFYRHKVEDQLDAMHSPVVQLRSGGSIVIHTTEALTAVDVNSGRATRERHIEETAVKTNLEAADEIARQLRLRDLAGLVVVDFIDMNEARNQRAVERRMRDALKADRARIQLGRISAFGLLELSRQRLRPSFQELSSQPCPSCGGTGVIRSTESSALKALRVVEEEGIGRRAAAIELALPTDVALYILNQKRDALVGLESRYGMRVRIRLDDSLSPPHYRLERLEPRREEEPQPAEAVEEKPAAEDRPARAARPAREAAAPARAAAEEEDERARPDGEAGEAGKKRRRRRRRRKGRGEGAEAAPAEVLAPEVAPEVVPTAAEAPPEVVPAVAGGEAPEPQPEPGVLPPEAPAEAAEAGGAEAALEPAKPKRRRRRRPPAGAEPEAPPAAAGDDGGAPAAVAEEAGGAVPVEEPARPVAEEEAPPAWEGPAPAFAEPVPDEVVAAPEEAEVVAHAEAATAVATEEAAGAQPQHDEAGAGDVGAVPPAEPAEAVPPAAHGEPGGAAPAAGAGARPAEAEEDEEVRRREEVPAAAMAGEHEDQGDQGEPRRGWWSRWVRKDS